MIKYEVSNGDSVEVSSTDLFYLDVDSDSGCGRSRADLKEIRDAIDQALNTSVEEIEDAAN